MQAYTAAVNRKGAPLPNCIGFIDGTVRPLCRPSRHQRQLYNGHKRQHAIKFQSVMAPDGLIIHLSRPFPGRRHDSHILQESGLLDVLQRHCRVGDIRYCLYGDPAYSGSLSPHLHRPYPGNDPQSDQREFNEGMNRVREAVEWGFGQIVRYFAFLDFKKNMKVLLQPVAVYYAVGALLTNCYTCLYGSQTGQYFGIAPPRLEEYLHSRPWPAD